MTVLDLVVARLARERVPHALIGAAALAAAGVARSTFDLDLLTTDTRVLETRFWSELEGAGVSVVIRRGDADDPLAGVVRIESPGDRPVDVVVGRHAWQAAAVARAPAPPGGPPVVRPADLVLLKLYAGGSQDLWDIRELLALPDAASLQREVDSAVASLPGTMRELWASVRG